MFGPVEAMHAQTLKHLPAGSFPQGKLRLLQLADRAQIGFPPRGVLVRDLCRRSCQRPVGDGKTVRKIQG